MLQTIAQLIARHQNAPVNFTITVTPGGGSSIAQAPYKDTLETVTVDVGVPSSYVWSVVSGNGAIVSGQGTANATVRVTDPIQGDGISETATFQVEVTVSGTTKSATFQRTHTYRAAVDPPPGDPGGDGHF